MVMSWFASSLAMSSGLTLRSDHSHWSPIPRIVARCMALKRKAWGACASPSGMSASLQADASVRNVGSTLAGWLADLR